MVFALFVFNFRPTFFVFTFAESSDPPLGAVSAADEVSYRVY